MSKTEIIAAYTVVIFEAIDEFWGEHIREVWKDQNGDIHRDGDEPAVICKNVETGAVIQCEWYQNGLRHRDDGKPALAHDNGQGFIREEYYVNDELHRENGPALYDKLENGIVRREEYFKHGKEHRDDGPSTVHRDNFTGVAELEFYYKNGIPHREDGPASIYRCTVSGVAITESWYRNGKIHRADGGPVEVSRHFQTGEITEEKYAKDLAPDSPAVDKPAGPLI